MKKVLVSLLCLVSLVAKAQISDEIYYTETPPFKSLFIENYSEEQARAYLDSAMIDIWEGIWEFIRHETVVCIERFSNDHFSAQFTHRIILLHSEKYTGIPTGTVIGYLTKEWIEDGTFCWLYDIRMGSAMLYPKRKTAVLSNDDNFIHFLRTRKRNGYIFRSLVSKGFRRVYPKVEHQKYRVEDIYL